MARLTDEELERVLRETFADKEELLDTLPQATTKRRRPVAPVLLAAAAVLVVLGSILYGVNRGGDVNPAPPVAAAPAGDNAEIWAAAITAVTQKFQPEYDLRSVDLSGQTFVVMTASERTSRPPVFTVPEKDRIADQVARAANVQVSWVDGSLQNQHCIRSRAEVSVGKVVDKDDHKEVRTRIAYNCGYGYMLTYRIEKSGGRWTVTGTVGVPEGVIPAGCPLTQSSPANRQHGC
jgi:hypothetical protein